MCHKFFDSPSEKREKSLPLSPLPREMYKHLEKVRLQKELVQKKTYRKSQKKMRKTMCIQLIVVTYMYMLIGLR